MLFWCLCLAFCSKSTIFTIVLTAVTIILAIFIIVSNIKFILCLYFPSYPSLILEVLKVYSLWQKANRLPFQGNTFYPLILTHSKNISTHLSTIFIKLFRLFLIHHLFQIVHFFCLPIIRFILFIFYILFLKFFNNTLL